MCALLDSAIHFMQEINQSEINSPIIFESEESLNEEIIAMKKAVMELQFSLYSERDLNSVWHSDEHLKILNIINDRNEYYKKIHSGLFIMGDKEDSSTECIYNEFLDIINETIDDLKSTTNPFRLVKNKKIVSENNQQIWYFWNSEIRNEIKYLLGNVRSNIGPLDAAGCLMNVNIEQTMDYLKITLSNLSEHDDNYVMQKTINKQRREMVRNKNLGVTVDYQSVPYEKGFLLNTIITIPSITNTLKNTTKKNYR